MDEEHTPSQDIGALLVSDSEAERFIGVAKAARELLTLARAEADKRTAHGRRWALVATKLEEVVMQAEWGYRES